MGTDYKYADIAAELNSLPHLTSKEKASLLSILAASGVFEEEDYQEGWTDMGTTRVGLHSTCPVRPLHVQQCTACTSLLLAWSLT